MQMAAVNAACEITANQKLGFPVSNSVVEPVWVPFKTQTQGDIEIATTEFFDVSAGGGCNSLTCVMKKESCDGGGGGGTSDMVQFTGTSNKDGPLIKLTQANNEWGDWMSRCLSCTSGKTTTPVQQLF